MNLVEDKSEKLVESRRVEYFDADGGHVHYKLKFSTTFSDSLDLERLPYDRQLLRIQVVGEVPIYMMRFVPMDSQSAGALVYSKARLNEENPKRNVPVDWTVDRKRLPTLEILVEKDLFQRARFDIHIYLERNPNYYLVNVVFFVGVFTLCTGFAFSPGTAQSSSSNVDDALAGASAMGKFMPVMRMPWESTSLMRQVLCKERLPWLQPFKIPKTFPAVSSLYEKPRELVLMEKKIQIRSSCFNATIAHSDSDRNQVLLKWLEAVLIVPTESRLGNQLMALEPDADNAGKHLQIVADTLRKKSTKTLNVRMSSLLLYIRWHRDSFGDQQFLPFLEENVYSYMCSLRDKACSASRGTTFISTLSFVKQILGMTGVQECIESARASGAALSMYLCKRPLKQAPPLHPVMLAILELATFCESDAYLRCMAGFCLMCIYGRMRVSDVSRLVNLSVAGKFAEASLMRVKTSRSREKQTTFLPSVIPTFGVLGKDWFAAFLANRKHLGLEDFPPLEGRGHGRDFVVLPSEDTVPSEVLVKVSTSEVTAKLRIILGKFYDKATVCKLTSHSLKTTVLTYVSVYGIDYVHSELLGYHLTQHRSAINYQRDALSVPIRKMVEILEAVKDGTFVPLAARDEVFPSGGAKCVVDQVHEQIGYNFEEVLEMLLGFHLVFLFKENQGQSLSSFVKSCSVTEEQKLFTWDILWRRPRRHVADQWDQPMRFIMATWRRHGPFAFTASEEQQFEGEKGNVDAMFACMLHERPTLSRNGHVTGCAKRADVAIACVGCPRDEEVGQLKLAFSTNYTPGHSSLRALAAQIVQVDPCPANRLPIVRRLLFESYSLAAADMQLRVERKDDSIPRKLANAERSARYEDQRRRLSGVDISGELEPWNSLIDIVYHMTEEDQLRYVRWEECTKHDQELMGIESDPVWKPDANGLIRETKVMEVLKAETDTDLKLRTALQRRSLSFDQSRLVDYNVFERRTQIMMEAYSTHLLHKDTSRSPRLLTAEERTQLHLQHEAKLLSITSGDESTGTTNTMAKVGVYRTEYEFVQEALKLKHPFDSSVSVSDDAKRAMYWLLTCGPEEVKRNREQLFPHYAKLKEELKDEEYKLHSAMDPDRERLIHVKQILLFRRLCEDAGVDDPGLTDLLINGVQLTGQAEETGQFESLVVEPTMNNMQLMKFSKWTRKKVLSSNTRGCTQDVRTHIWQEALKEVEKGWLSGPYCEETLETMLGPRFIVSRRLGLVQSDKVRAIDDLSESFVYASYGTMWLKHVCLGLLICLQVHGEANDTDANASNDNVSTTLFPQTQCHISCTNLEALQSTLYDLKRRDAEGEDVTLLDQCIAVQKHVETVQCILQAGCRNMQKL
eukprot:symbB.v1.2.008656.t1/scaffold540.1/size189765/21